MSASKRTRIEQGIWSRTTKSGERRLEIQFRDGTGKVRRQVIEGGIREARTALAVAVLDRRSGDLRDREKVPTFAEAAEVWTEREVSRLRPATRRGYGSSLRHLLPVFGHRRLDQVSPGDVADYVADRERDGFKAWTVRAHLVAFRRVYNHAARRMGYRGPLPAQALDRSEKPRVGRSERRVLSTEELRRVLDAAEEPWRTTFAVLAATGIRLGELIGLTWRSVDLVEGLAHIREQVTKSVTIDYETDPGGRAALKTARARRVVPLALDVVAMLQAHRERSAFTGDDDPVFCRQDGRPVGHSQVQCKLVRVVRAAGIEQDEATGGNVSPHTFRRSFASRLIALGAPVTEVSALLGHADPTVTLSAYTFEFEQAQHAEARRARLESAFAGAFGDGGVYVVSTPAPEEAESGLPLAA